MGDGESAGTAGNKQQYPLHYACTQGVLDLVRNLVEGPEACDVNQPEAPQEWRPLHCAAVSCRSEVAKYLIHQGADVAARDADGWTALHMAASHGHCPLVVLLLDAHADHRARSSQGGEKHSPGDLDFVRILAEDREPEACDVNQPEARRPGPVDPGWPWS